jgi:two-component system LytT family response regulator
MRLQNDTWQVRADRQTHRIAISDIVFVESIRDYVKIHRSNGVMVAKMKLSDAEKELSDAGFIRVHRSFLVNQAHIASWSSESVALGDEVIPIGRSYRRKVLDLLTKDE